MAEGDELDEIVARHVERSLKELSDPAQQARWLNGERVKEQVDEIVADILAEEMKRLDTEN